MGEDDHQDGDDEAIEASNDEGNCANITVAKKKFTGEVRTYTLSWFVVSNINHSNQCGLMKMTMF